MKLHLSNPAGLNMITAYGADFVQVNDQRHPNSLILLPDSLTDWPVAAFRDLTTEHLARLLEFGPELVLLGTGRRHHFPHPALYGELLGARIGLEAMDTGAACRTYNILAAEGRRVAAALIVEA